MTDADKKEIATIMQTVLATHDRQCPIGLDKETADTLKAFAEAIKIGKKTALKAVITLFVGVIFTALGAGIVHLIFYKGAH